jgi:pentatricopeptide repeat protein
MNDLNVTPNVLTYTVYISLLSKHNEPELALKMFQQCVKNGIDVDTPLLNATLSIFNKVSFKTVFF